MPEQDSFSRQQAAIDTAKRLRLTNINLILKLTKESQGYCPKCGHWAINTGTTGVNNQKIDKCSVCDTIFTFSGLEFLDSQQCKCGHPRSWHDRSICSCERGRIRVNCECKKYQPTSVVIIENNKIL